MPRNPFLLAALGIGLLGGLVLLLNALFPGALASGDAGPDLVAKIMLLVFLVASVAVGGRVNLSESLRYGVIWVVIGLVLVLGYAMRHDFQALGTRLMSALVPSAAQQIEPGAVALTKSRNGHFMARAAVTGPDLDQGTITFLVDTGATRVSLSAADARRIGIDPDTLVYDKVVQTANGTNQAASVRLRRIGIGDIVVDDVPADVVRRGLNVSLLGHSYLDRLSGFDVRQDQLVLRR